MKLCAKGYPNRIPNGREKREQTDTQTHRHFRIYISRDYKARRTIKKDVE